MSVFLRLKYKYYAHSQPIIRALLACTVHILSQSSELCWPVLSTFSANHQSSVGLYYPHSQPIIRALLACTVHILSQSSELCWPVLSTFSANHQSSVGLYCPHSQPIIRVLLACTVHNLSQSSELCWPVLSTISANHQSSAGLYCPHSQPIIRVLLALCICIKKNFLQDKRNVLSSISSQLLATSSATFRMLILFKKSYFKFSYFQNVNPLHEIIFPSSSTSSSRSVLLSLLLTATKCLDPLAG